MRSLAIVVALTLLPWATARADCCAGGHVDYLVHGSQFGYGGGIARGRSVRLFAGVANPRYALPPLDVRTPVQDVRPRHQFTRQMLVSTPQLESLAAANQWQSAHYASDADLMDQPIEEPAANPSSGPDTLEYPGQAFGQLGAKSEVPQSRQHAAQAEASAQDQASRTARSPSRRTQARLAAADTKRAAGAFANESAARIARQLRATGVEF